MFMLSLSAILIYHRSFTLLESVVTKDRFLYDEYVMFT